MTVLEFLRRRRSLLQGQLGGQAAVNRSRISQFERGRATPPSGSVELRRLAEVLAWHGEPADLLSEVGTILEVESRTQ